MVSRGLVLVSAFLVGGLVQLLHRPQSLMPCGMFALARGLFGLVIFQIDGIAMSAAPWPPDGTWACPLHGFSPLGAFGACNGTASVTWEKCAVS